MFVIGVKNDGMLPWLKLLSMWSGGPKIPKIIQKSNNTITLYI